MREAAHMQREQQLELGHLRWEQFARQVEQRIAEVHVGVTHRDRLLLGNTAPTARDTSTAMQGTRDTSQRKYAPFVGANTHTQRMARTSGGGG